MSKLKNSKKIEILFKMPSFTSVEAAEAGMSRMTLSRYVKAGKLMKIGRSYFDPTSRIDTDFQWEDLVRLMKGLNDGIVCLITALSIYDLTDEISREFWIAVPHSRWAPKIERTRIVRMRNMELGVTTATLGAETVRIFDRERTVVDSFRHLDKEVAIKALRRLVRSQGDLKRLRRYSNELKANIDPYILAVTT